VNARAIQHVQDITADYYQQVDYRVCRTTEDIDVYLYSSKFIHAETLGEDTESLPGPDYNGWEASSHIFHGPAYCLTFSNSPGTGRLIYARDRHLIQHYAWKVKQLDPLHIFHNYLHDIVPMDELEIPVDKFLDTMVRAYNLCLGGGGDDEEGSKAGRGSLGLKQLSYRFLNMRMTSFKDTVFPYSVPLLREYLLQAQSMFAYEDRSIKKCKCGCLQDRHLPKGIKNFLHGQCTGCKSCDKYRAYKYPPLTEEDDRLNRLHRKVTGLVEAIDSGKCERDDEEDIVNPWVRIKGWHDYDHRALKETLGKWPVPSIAHVPEPQLVYYAVRDADADRRLYHFLLNHHPWVFYQ
jgi:hypothetical protein